MKQSITICIFLLTILTIISRFWIGIYEDYKFGEHLPFIKYKPTWKWYFYSPRGMSDWKTEDMPPNLKKEQLLYDEFILTH